jgi:hypothetical protein
MMQIEWEGASISFNVRISFRPHDRQINMQLECSAAMPDHSHEESRPT